MFCKLMLLALSPAACLVPLALPPESHAQSNEVYVRDPQTGRRFRVDISQSPRLQQEYRSIMAEKQRLSKRLQRYEDEKKAISLEMAALQKEAKALAALQKKVASMPRGRFVTSGTPGNGNYSGRWVPNPERAKLQGQLTTRTASAQRRLNALKQRGDALGLERNRLRDALGDQDQRLQRWNAEAAKLPELTEV